MWRAFVAASIVLWSCTAPALAQPYEPQPMPVPAPPLDTDLASNVLVTSSSIVTVEAVAMPWQGGLPAYKLDQQVVTFVVPSTIQWSSPLIDAAAFGPIWEGTLVEVSYINRDRAYLLNCATGNYAWVDLAYLRQADAGGKPPTCNEYWALHGTPSATGGLGNSDPRAVDGESGSLGTGASDGGDTATGDTGPLGAVVGPSLP